MRKGLEIGGIVAAVVLDGFRNRFDRPGDRWSRHRDRHHWNGENIVGTPDMTPDAIAAEAKEAGLKASVDLPTCDIAELPVDSGERARCFASYMRIHALEATGGYTDAEMGRYESKPNAPKSELAPGGGTEEENVRRPRPRNGRTRRKRRPQRLGHGDGSLDRAQHELHGRPPFPLRHGDRHRAAADRHRIRGPRPGRGREQPGHRAALPALAQAHLPHRDAPDSDA